MTSRPTGRRQAFWLVALALLLKSALPLLAAASAHAQGRTLVEVCTVYGVATVDLGAQSDAPGRDLPVGAHAAEACALTAVVALGAPVPPGASLPSRAVTRRAGSDPVPAAPAGPDAGADWVAWVQHAPPRLA